jgi:hypothetical protein
MTAALPGERPACRRTSKQAQDCPFALFARGPFLRCTVSDEAWDAAFRRGNCERLDYDRLRDARELVPAARQDRIIQAAGYCGCITRAAQGVAQRPRNSDRPFSGPKQLVEARLPAGMLERPACQIAQPAGVRIPQTRLRCSTSPDGLCAVDGSKARTRRLRP